MVKLVVLLQIAASFWAAQPGAAARNVCPDGVRYAVVDPSALVNPDVGTHKVLAEAELGGCSIQFRAGWRRLVSDRQACNGVVHEYGHAAYALGHVDDPRNVMRPVPASGPPVAPCRRFSVKR